MAGHKVVCGRNPSELLVEVCPANAYIYCNISCDISYPSKNYRIKCARIVVTTDTIIGHTTL